MEHIDKSNSEFWSLMYEHQIKKYPNILKLRMIGFCIPLTTVACETGFSKLKLIKSPLRSRLNEASLDVAMRVSIEGGDFDDVMFEEAFAHLRRKLS